MEGDMFAAATDEDLWAQSIIFSALHYDEDTFLDLKSFHSDDYRKWTTRTLWDYNNECDYLEALRYLNENYITPCLTEFYILEFTCDVRRLYEAESSLEETTTFGGIIAFIDVVECGAPGFKDTSHSTNHGRNTPDYDGTNKRNGDQLILFKQSMMKKVSHREFKGTRRLFDRGKFTN